MISLQQIPIQTSQLINSSSEIRKANSVVKRSKKRNSKASGSKISGSLLMNENEIAGAKER